MCNPTSGPREANRSASSSSSAPSSNAGGSSRTIMPLLPTSQLPISPASTPSFSSPPSSSSSTSSASAHPGGGAPRMILKHKRREEEDGSHESRNDDPAHPQRQGPLHWRRPNADFLRGGSVVDRNQDDEDDEEEEEEHEIPSLIDEDHDLHDDSPIPHRNSEQATHEPASRDGYQPWQQRQRQQQEENDDDRHPSEQHEGAQEYPRMRRHASAPPVQKKQQSLPRSGGDAKPSSSSSDDHHHRSEAITCNAKDAALPFFVLDWMLEDLVPEDRTAQDVANLLNHPPTKPLRKSKSLGLDVGTLGRATTTTTSASSPSLHRFLPWPSAEATPAADETRTNPHPLRSSSTAAATAATSPSPVYPEPPASPVRSPHLAPVHPTLPKTPKSSNRKACKMRQKQHPNSEDGGPVDPDGHHCDADATDNHLLYVPRNLNGSFDQASSGSGAERESQASTNLSHTLLPRTNPAPRSPALPAAAEQEGGSYQSEGSMGKKSFSCPQFLQDEDDDDETASSPDHHRSHSPPTPLMRKRAQEQSERRERRNKLTIVQRSLTLAQGWNNKGLAMAGNATRAELREQQLIEQQQQQQQQYRVNGITSPKQQQQSNAGPACSESQPRHGAPSHWWESSLVCWDNALEIYRSLLGEYHERVADVQNNRGIALGKLERFEEALGALEVALRARKKQMRRLVEQDDNGRREAGAAGERNRHTEKANDAAAAIQVVIAAIVSTLHNIANVFREAGNSTEALKILIEAQMTLRESERDLLRKGGSGKGGAATAASHHRQHQSARLGTAIGHIFYESERWRDARDHYGDALEIYERLLASLSKQSDRLGWGGNGNSSSSSSSSRRQPPSDNDDHRGNDEAQQRLELLRHRQLLQREVAALELDLDELDRCQQAREGSRARLLQARQRQQHQKNKQPQTPPRPQQRHQQRAQQQQQQQSPSLFGIVSTLRA